jgi:hypothetical protein
MKKIYLYLARRDKKGVRVLGVFKGNEISLVRNPDLNSMSLPAVMANEIKREVHDNRMLWELWAESVESYEVLKKNLKNRGYSNMPIHSSPIRAKRQDVIADTSQINGQRTMLR